MEKAFISWSSIDPRIGPLAEAFKNWATRVFDGNLQFFYSKEISYGANSVGEIYNALDTTQFGFLFLSQLTSRSPWVIYEFGCLYPLAKDRRVFPLLFDLKPDELADICPPMAPLQAASIVDPKAVVKLVADLCSLMKLKDQERLAINARAVASSSELSRAIVELSAEQTILPERFAGQVYYNNRIGMSKNFNMPEIFNIAKKELFLVGINHAFLLNLRDNTTRMEAMLRALHENDSLTVRVLISDLWDEKIRYTYNYVLGGRGSHEMVGLDEVFLEHTSELYLHKFIEKFCIANNLNVESIRKRFSIKTIPMLMDSFWFVDVDLPNNVGNMMLLPMTAEHGSDRAAFYANARHHHDLLRYYFDLCGQGWSIGNKSLWPGKLAAPAAFRASAEGPEPG